jgi:uncharacterized protein DUF4160
MPIIMQSEGFAVIVYPNDHNPAHVHVFSAGHEAVFNLNCPGGPVALRENYGFSRRDVARVRKLLDATTTKLCQQWRNIHGES